MHLTFQPAEVSGLHNPVPSKHTPKGHVPCGFLGCELALLRFPGVFSFTPPNQDVAPGVALMNMVRSPYYLSDGWFTPQKG